MEVQINYKKSVIEYFKTITNDEAMAAQAFKLLSMLELISSDLNEEQWKKLYNVVLW